jgi:hypothetical protein
MSGWSGLSGRNSSNLRNIAFRGMPCLLRETVERISIADTRIQIFRLLAFCFNPYYNHFRKEIKRSLNAYH